MKSPRADKLRALLAELEQMDDGADRDRLLRETRTRIADLEAGDAMGIDWGDSGGARRPRREREDTSPIEFLS